MSGFIAGIFGGSQRKIRCPYCRRDQVIPRQPLPFLLPCPNCRKPLQITEKGAAIPPKR